MISDSSVLGRCHLFKGLSPLITLIICYVNLVPSRTCSWPPFVIQDLLNPFTALVLRSFFSFSSPSSLSLLLITTAGPVYNLSPKATSAWPVSDSPGYTSNP